VWRTRLGDINRGESMTMAPLVVRDKVLVGNSGGEFGVRGWLTALEAGSGESRGARTAPARTRTCSSATDFRPFYESDRGPDLGVTTWPPEQWRIGGGTVWGWISYDPELEPHLLRHGNPGVWNPALRPGDNKWSSASCSRAIRTPVMARVGVSVRAPR
jgi:lanthanide-dependent methanol dehydrogenase